MTVLIVLGQMAVLLAMMAIGAVGSKRGILTAEFGKGLSWVVVNILNPILIIDGALAGARELDAVIFTQNFVFVLVYYAISILAGIAIMHILRPKREHKSIYILMVTFANVGFMGIPVIKSVYGEAAVSLVIFYMLFFNLLAYTYGYFFANKSGIELSNQINIASSGLNDNTLSKKDIKQSVKEKKKSNPLLKIINPGVIACILAFLILIFKIQAPSFIKTFTNYMGNATIPMSMIVVGMSLGKAKIKDFFCDFRIYLMCFIRMLMIPIIAAFIIKNLNFNPLVMGTFVLELSMPCGSVIGMLVTECGGDGDYCMKGILLTSVISMITIPIVSFFL